MHSPHVAWVCKRTVDTSVVDACRTEVDVIARIHIDSVSESRLEEMSTRELAVTEAEEALSHGLFSRETRRVHTTVGTRLLHRLRVVPNSGRMSWMTWARRPSCILGLAQDLEPSAWGHENRQQRSGTLFLRLQALNESTASASRYGHQSAAAEFGAALIGMIRGGVRAALLARWPAAPFQACPSMQRLLIARSARSARRLRRP